MRSRLHPHNDGFTLAELLVASTVLAIVLGTVYTAFSSSVSMWKIGESNIAVYQDARVALDVMTRELQNMVPDAAHLFVGSKDEFEFYAVTRPMDVEEGAEPKVLWITYRVKSDPDGEGKLLIREERPVESPMPVAPPEDGTIDDTIIELGSESQFELAAGVKKLDFHYYWVQPEEGGGLFGESEAAPAEFVIRDEHEEKSGIPQAIRIDLTFIDPLAETGETTFTTYAVMHGPTTTLEDGSIDAQTVALQ
ncbi:MAG: prepilin-type N-terminal cleavage/methylation domain-containing protein [Candidatus Hydrogenedentes bacterium]|nr:prepilin-type N-terminal cleavage/methylation domain-containing protein [Candidatus Hydrogenedentota bacterium]